jgi:uncharacterized membrane protein YadS
LSDQAATVLVVIAVVISILALVNAGLRIDIPLVRSAGIPALVLAAALTAWSTFQLFGLTKNFSPAAYLSRLIFPGVRRLQRSLAGTA